MQSVSLKKSLTLPRSAQSRRFSSFLSALLVVAGMLSLAIACHAQDTQTMQTVTQPKEKFDVGVAGFYQVTGPPTATSFAMIQPSREAHWSVFASLGVPGLATR